MDNIIYGRARVACMYAGKYWLLLARATIVMTRGTECFFSLQRTITTTTTTTTSAYQAWPTTLCTSNRVKTEYATTVTVCARRRQRRYYLFSYRPFYTKNLVFKRTDSLSDKYYGRAIDISRIAELGFFSFNFCNSKRKIDCFHTLWRIFPINTTEVYQDSAYFSLSISTCFDMFQISNYSKRIYVIRLVNVYDVRTSAFALGEETLVGWISIGSLSFCFVRPEERWQEDVARKSRGAVRDCQRCARVDRYYLTRYEGT